MNRSNGSDQRLDFLHLEGARVHNLQDVEVRIPHGRITVITGPSGSGKSSLAFHTIYAEGYRRYVETFSPYTRQFLERLPKPEVRKIEGILPAIAVEQGRTVKSARSTVATLTQILDLLKALFARLARASCRTCGEELRPLEPREIAQELLTLGKDRQAVVLFPMSVPEGASWEELFLFLRSQGYLRIWWGEEVRRVDQEPPQGQPEGVLWVVADRLRLHEDHLSRLTDSLERALDLGKGRVDILLTEGEGEGKRLCFTSRWLCPRCGHGDLPEPEPSLFTPHHPLGACDQCQGFGRVLSWDPGKIVPDPSLSLSQGALAPLRWRRAEGWRSLLFLACENRGVPWHVPFCELSEAQKRWVFYGDLSEKQDKWPGIFAYLDWLTSKSFNTHVRVFLSRYRSYVPCEACRGSGFHTRARRFWLAFANGQRLGIAEVLALSAQEALERFCRLPIPSWDQVSQELRAELLRRLEALVDVGLGYLTLNRPSRTLSGGETQRVHLISCLGSGLVHTLFVLDEPTVGLHASDTLRLIRALEKLPDQGNTVVLVEHDEAVIRSADYVIEMGPGRGSRGGRIVFAGALRDLLDQASSLTGAYLSGKLSVLPSRRRHPRPGFWLTLRGVQAHNLAGIDVSFPLGLFVCIVGVSGSGKSTLVEEGLIAALSEKLSLPRGTQGEGFVRGVEGWEEIQSVAFVDSSPPARSPRSVVASYVGVLDCVRELFAGTDDARVRELRPGDFSFNAGKGRCPRCKGAGVEEISMQFLADVWVPCTACEGRRFQGPVLEVRYFGRTILEVLELTVEEALEFFRGISPQAEPWERKARERLCDALALLDSVGLGYVKLGQRLSELSGGESQRIKLAAELLQRSGVSRRQGEASGTRLLIMDEPSVGLHPDDLQALLRTFDRLIDAGCSLIVIEHNLDLIRSADWLVELGPGGGPAGGRVVASGPPEELASLPESPTGRFLKEKLGASKVFPARLPQGSGLAESRNLRAISIRKARHHNLKSVSLEIPLGRWTVFSGLSGSGKSTLAFDVLFAEGQRRYLECVSPYARQFLGQLERPEVESVTGVPPAVAVEQRASPAGPKSTVGTLTEIYPFLRLLYAKLGLPHDPETGEPARKQSLEEIVQEVDQALRKASSLWILAPLVRARKGSYRQLGSWARKKGYRYLRVDGRLLPVEEYRSLARFVEHTIEVVLGELRARDCQQTLRTMLQTALTLGKGSLYTLDPAGELRLYSVHFHCPGTGRSFDELDPRLFSFHSPHGWCPACRGFGMALSRRKLALLAEEEPLEGEGLLGGREEPCPACQGDRLQPFSRRVTLPLGRWRRPGGPSLPELCRLTIRELFRYWDSIVLEGDAKRVASEIVGEVRQRLLFLQNVGLGYLTLYRSIASLSAGESQRIRLAAQLGSPLQGVLYVLDEPTIGLHPRETESLLKAVADLKERGNTIVMVEHDEEALRRADWIVELGPGAGKKGGQIVAQGTWAHLETRDTLTRRAGEWGRSHPLTGARRPCPGEQGWLVVEGARVHNLKNLTVRVPLGRLVVVCGPSGAGKSTLLCHVLLAAVWEETSGKHCQGSPGQGSGGTAWTRVAGTERLGGVRLVDGEPIGKTPRSTPATYIGLMNLLREFFSTLPLARQRGYGPGRFSYNNREGQCPDCRGCGFLKAELPLLPPTVLRCPRCKGSRFNPQTLEVTYRGKNIAEVLEMTAEEALELFRGLPRVERKLALLCQVGLGYLPLGQPSPSLSGGEAQRVKLVAELQESSESHSVQVLRSRRWLLPYLYLLEEPTIGLHRDDVTSLLTTLQALVAQGHTVVVVEHHPGVIAEADWVIELGPGAAEEGGKIVVEGTPEEVARCSFSPTAPYLRPVLGL